MYDTARNLSDKHKHIHELCAPYLKELGVIDLGNHFEIYTYIVNNPLMIDFLKEECSKYKKSNVSDKPNIYTYLEEIDDNQYSPHIILIDKNYVVNIDNTCRVIIYNHNLEKIIEYKYSKENFDISIIKCFNPEFYMNKAEESINIFLPHSLILSRNIDNKKIHSLFNSDTGLFIRNIQFEDKCIFVSFQESSYAYSNIIFDYDFNMIGLKFNSKIRKDLNIDYVLNASNKEEIFNLIEPNLEMFFLENDFKYKINFNENEIMEHGNNIKKIFTVKNIMGETFDNILNTINLQEQKKLSTKKELFSNFSNFTSNPMIEEIDKKYNFNKFYSDDNTINNYYSIIATLSLLKEKNENLIDYKLIDKVLYIEKITDKFIKNYNTETKTLKNKI